MKAYKGYARSEQSGYEPLPKGAYVIKLLNVKEEPNSNGNGSHLKIAFDIAEGEYTDFYMNAFNSSTKEDKKWNNDAYLYMNCPDDNSPQWTVDNFNKFITAVEDSNEGYHWNWDESTLKSRIVGAKFCIEQSEYNGKVYDHTKAKWFVTAQKVRDGKAGKLPNDKMIASAPNKNTDDYMSIPDAIDEELPWN